MDSTSETAPRDSDIINKTIPMGDARIRQPKAPQGLKYHQRTAVTGDALIRHPKQPLGTEK